MPASSSKRAIFSMLAFGCFLFAAKLTAAENKSQFIPESELKKLAVDCQVTQYSEVLRCSVYNGSNWKVVGSRNSGARFPEILAHSVLLDKLSSRLR
jgi:hypothetical protein